MNFHNEKLQLFYNQIKITREPTGQFADWQMAFKNQSMYLSYPLRNWVILTTRRMQSQVQNFVRMIEKASRQMNFEVAPAYM